MPLLSVENLTVSLPNIAIVKGVSFELHPGTSTVLVGESGSGKTTLALAMIGAFHLIQEYDVQGSSKFMGRDLLLAKRSELSSWMGKEISIILQDPSLTLHPLYTIGEQISEVTEAHGFFEKRADLLIEEAMNRVNLSIEILQKYPHELSGGQKQRALIAMATLFAPKLLICDEPTASLDPTRQNEILRLLLSIQEKEKTALFFVTHDMKAVRALGEEIFVMHEGQIVETSTKSDFFTRPKHPYTQALLAAAPENLRL